MNSSPIYTFRTNKYVDEFKRADIDVFVFGKLKEDLVTFAELIQKAQPRQIVGLAKVRTSSKLETLAINAFGRDRKVNKTGKDRYSLHTPSGIDFKKSKKPTKSFCNWTMYKIGEMAAPKHIKNSFVYFNKRDFPKVLDFTKTISAAEASTCPLKNS